MDLSLRDAAALLGVPPRTLRSRLARGEVSGRKEGAQWRINSRTLPMTEAQRRRLRERESEIEKVLAEVTTPARKRIGLLDSDVLALGRELLDELRSDRWTATHLEHRSAAIESFTAALLDVGQATHEFQPARRERMLRRARTRLARALVHLQLCGPDPLAILESCTHRCEERIFPPLAGMLRSLERSTSQGGRSTRKGVEPPSHSRRAPSSRQGLA